MLLCVYGVCGKVCVLMYPLSLSLSLSLSLDRLLQNSALGLEGMGDLGHGILDLSDTDITDKVPSTPLYSTSTEDCKRIMLIVYTSVVYTILY